MKKQIKEIFESIKQNAAYDIIKAVALLVFTSGSSYTIFHNVISKAKDLPLWTIIVLSVSASALVSFLVLVLYQKNSEKYTEAKRVRCNYVILNRNLTFIYNEKVCTYEADITLKFKKNCREYYGKFYWSGSGEGKIEVKEPGHKLNILTQRNRYIEYMVVFDKEYRKGDKLNFHLEGKMEDEEGAFSPYFSSAIDKPTKNLKITLKIDPKKYPVKTLEKESFAPTEYNHSDAENVNLNDRGEYVWEVKKPKLSYCYSLNWKFE